VSAIYGETVSALDDLLVLQDHDSAIDRLRHRLHTLPERAALGGNEAAQAALAVRIEEAVGRRDEAARVERRVEDELASVEAKIIEVEKKLYSGSVSAPRELQALQADVASLQRHKSTLEDDVLVAMETREPIDVEVRVLEAERDALDADALRLLAVIAEASTDLEAELASEETMREAAAGKVPSELLAHYDELRAKLGGVAAARLVGPTCTGCHLSLPATEIDRIKHLSPDEVAHCDQCGRILVRS
jgi:predicted  nucleic acid-binding Zn-ribbon protein